MNHPKTSNWGFSTHYKITAGNETLTMIARFHPTDKYWFYFSDNGDIIGFANGDTFFGTAYILVEQWFDEDHWWNEITYKEPKEPIEYHECN